MKVPEAPVEKITVSITECSKVFFLFVFVFYFALIVVINCTAFCIGFDDLRIQCKNEIIYYEIHLKSRNYLMKYFNIF